MTRSIKALFVAHAPDIGGAQLALLEALEGLDAQAIRPSVLVPADGPVAERARAAGADIAVLPVPWWLGSSQSPGPLRRHYLQDLPDYSRAVAELIEKRQIDVVYSGSCVVLHAAVAAALSGRPHVWHVHENLYDPGLPLVLPPGAARTVWAAIRLLSTTVIVPTLSICPGATEKVIAIPCGVRAPDAKTVGALNLPGRAGARVGLIGEVSRAKGADIVPHVLRELSVMNDDVELLWVGGHDESARIDLEHTTLLGGRKRLHLLGYQSDIWPFLRSIDLLLHPSWNETLPRVLMEAAVAGVPAVATLTGGTAEIVRDGITGYLVAPGDTRQLAARVHHLLSDPGKRLAMGIAARQQSDRFSLEAYQSRVAQTVREAFARGPAIRRPAALHLLRGTVTVPRLASTVWRMIKRPLLGGER